MDKTNIRQKAFFIRLFHLYLHSTKQHKDMTKQISLYRSVLNFINQFNPGQTYTSQDFKTYLGPITREKGQHRMWNGQWYRVRSYQSYLRSIGMLTNVSRGVWRVNYNIPEWMSLTVVETLKGYKDYTGHYTKDKNAVERRESYASALESFKAMSDKSKTPQPKFNIGDKVICVATEKIPTDGKNFTEACGIKIGDVLTVSRPSEPYTHSDRSLVIEFKEKGSLHLASNFKIWIPTPPKNIFKPKVGDKVKLVSKTSDFYADAKEYIHREKLTLGSTYTVSRVCHNGKPDEWADMFVELKEGRSGCEFNIPVDCFEPVTPKKDKDRDYTGTVFEETSSGNLFRIVKRANATRYTVDKLLDPAGDWSRTRPIEYISFTADEITGNLGRTWQVRTQTLKSELITAMARVKNDDELRAILKKILA